jgi:phosphoadenosine phosphosulfate reductase
MRGHPLTVIRQARQLTSSVLVGLSGGKDSLAVLQLCHEHGFRLAAYFQYFVPGIRFQEEILQYCERRYGLQVLRLPHWGLSHQLREWCFRNPHFSGDCPRLQLLDVENYAREQTGVQWIATGQRKDDSLERRAMLSKCGGIDVKNRRFWPLAEWGKRHVFSYLARSRVPLPADYNLFNGSWGGRLYATDLVAIKKAYPDDYEKICRYFPYAAAQIKRAEILAAQQTPELRDDAAAA